MNTQTLSRVVQEICTSFQEDAAIAIADRQQYIYYHPSERIDLKIKPGDTLKEQSLAYQVVHVRKKVENYVSKDVFGVPYYGISFPFIENDEVRGSVTAIFPQPIMKEKPQPKLLIGKAEDCWVPIAYDQVTYIQAFQGKTLLHTDNQIYSCKYNLNQLESMLPAEQFYRTHRSFIINIYKIAEIQPDFHSTFLLIMKDQGKSIVPVSQRYASTFRDWLGF